MAEQECDGMAGSVNLAECCGDLVRAPMVITWATIETKRFRNGNGKVLWLGRVRRCGRGSTYTAVGYNTRDEAIRTAANYCVGMGWMIETIK